MSDTVLASGADERYGWWLLNMVGSVHANSPATFDRIVLYDMGLSPLQLRLAAGIRNVEVREVPPFVPHWRQGMTWRAWVLTHLESDVLFWLDAGLTVLSSLDSVLAEIRERGYFVVSQAHPVRLMLPTAFYDLYGIGDEVADRVTVAGGILGFARRSSFYDRVVVPAYKDYVEARNLGFAAVEEVKLNRGLNRQEAPILHDSAVFRPGQVFLNIHLYRSFPAPVVADFDTYGSSERTPGQVVWAHRRRGDFRYLGRVPYRLRTALVGLPAGFAVRARWWLGLHRWLFRLSTYTRKARRLAAGRR